nr:unnamed protein product [Spirometra erinaceieuropaei]
MHFQSRLSTATVHELLFADDCALNTSSERNMRKSMDFFTAAWHNFGLVINTVKTVFMHQLSPDAAYVAPQVNENSTQMQVVDNFAYLNGTPLTLSRSKMKWFAGFPKPAKPSVVCKTKFGIDAVSTQH